MSYKPENSGSVRNYLKQRDAAEVLRDAQRQDHLYRFSKDWLAEYHTRGRKTRFNWSPTITGTITKEVTNGESTKEEAISGAKEEDRGRSEGQLGEAPGEYESGSLRGNTDAGSRFTRPGHQDFADGDTPF